MEDFYLVFRFLRKNFEREVSNIQKIDMHIKEGLLWFLADFTRTFFFWAV